MNKTETLKERMLLRVELGKIYEENLKLMESKEADEDELYRLRNVMDAFLRWFTVNRKVLKKTPITKAPIRWVDIVEKSSNTQYSKKGG